MSTFLQPPKDLHHEGSLAVPPGGDEEDGLSGFQVSDQLGEFRLSIGEVRPLHDPAVWKGVAHCHGRVIYKDV